MFGLFCIATSGFVNLETYIRTYNNTHKLAINKFINNTVYNAGYKNMRETSCGVVLGDNNKNMNYPAQLDWRTKGVVTRVKNQGQCGSCWSFSATGALESVWGIYSNQLVEFSEQQLMDCSEAYGNHGCNGGDMTAAFEYVIDNGICLETDIPYEGKDDSCPSELCDRSPHFSECKVLDEGNQLQMLEYVQKHPLSVGIQANQPLFTFYKSGVITTSECGTEVDHGVLVVGYGTEDGHDYWLVKNSWGSDWGDNGYVKIGRSSSSNDIGVCGIGSSVSFPVV